MDNGQLPDKYQKKTRWSLKGMNASATARICRFIILNIKQKKSDSIKINWKSVMAKF